MMQAHTQWSVHHMPEMGVTVQPARARSGVGAGVSGYHCPPSPQRLVWATIGEGIVLPRPQASDSVRIQKRSMTVRAAIQEEKPKIDVEETARKKGLEAGLWQIFTSKEKSDENIVSKASQAKDLLTRYGSAYLATSISLSLISFGLCYVLVNSGVPVTSLLELIGIHTNETGEKVGTFALAYAAHKAASPIRFPPTVALTPIVAAFFKKKPEEDKES